MGKVVTNWFSQIDAMIPMAGMTGALLTGNGVTLDTVAFWTMAIWVYNQISAYVRQCTCNKQQWVGGMSREAKEEET